jgi:hypothetical protein
MSKQKYDSQPTEFSVTGGGTDFGLFLQSTLLLNYHHPKIQ